MNSAVANRVYISTIQDQRLLLFWKVPAARSFSMFRPKKNSLTCYRRIKVIISYVKHNIRTYKYLMFEKTLCASYYFQINLYSYPIKRMTNYYIHLCWVIRRWFIEMHVVPVTSSVKLQVHSCTLLQVEIESSYTIFFTLK